MRKRDLDMSVKRLGKHKCLRPESAISLLHAERFAYAQRRPLNVFITMKLPNTNRHGERSYDVFRKKFWANTQRRWARIVGEARKQSPFDAIAIFENPIRISSAGRRHSGPYHVHWMIRWPFRKCERLDYFLRRQFQREFYSAAPGCVRITRVRNSPAAAAYMAKGIDPPFAKHLHLNHVNQGLIEHRRLIVSRSLGPTAMSKAKASGKDPLPKRRNAQYKKYRKVDLPRLIAAERALPKKKSSSSGLPAKCRASPKSLKAAVKASVIASGPLVKRRLQNS